VQVLRLPFLRALAKAALASAARKKRNAPLRYWYYYLPDYALAVLMYTLLGRVLLGLMIDANSTNYIWRFFCRITEPVVTLVSAVTPKAAAPVVVWLFGVVWLFWLRVAFLYAFLMLTADPRAA
jgi:YggT family protein